MKAHTLVLVDTHYLCHRAFFTTGGLSFGERSTGVAYGVLRELRYLQERFGRGTEFAFAFDSKSSKRKRILPSYKSNRKKENLSPDEVRKFRELRKEIKALRREILPKLGFGNVFIQRGYEGDDIIASLCKAHPKKDKIVVSGDKDLWQLVGPSTRVYMPNGQKMVAVQRLFKETGLTPEQWMMVKVLAGCKSDCVPGIPGIGEKTAIKYILGELKTGAKRKSILAVWNDRDTMQRNLALVSLPLPGLDPFKLQIEASTNTEKKWRKVTRMLGIRSL